MANKWIMFLKDYRKKNPNLSYKEAMMEAKKHYKKGSSAVVEEKKPTKVKAKKVKGGGYSMPVEPVGQSHKVAGGMMKMKGGGTCGGGMVGGDKGVYHGRYSSYSGGNIGEKTDTINYGNRAKLEGDDKYASVNTYQNKNEMRPMNKHINF